SSMTRGLPVLLCAAGCPNSCTRSTASASLDAATRRAYTAPQISNTAHPHRQTIGSAGPRVGCPAASTGAGRKADVNAHSAAQLTHRLPVTIHELARRTQHGCQRAV